MSLLLGSRKVDPEGDRLGGGDLYPARLGVWPREGIGAAICLASLRLGVRCWLGHLAVLGARGV